MNQIRLETISIPAALIGRENTLPQIRHFSNDCEPIPVDESVPETDRKYLGYGAGHSPADPCYPYLLQDDYGRERAPEEFRVAVLENDFLKATFLLDYGARLWSLKHKKTGLDLVEVNPVFQPANLAIRNAWFSGGVEWNIGVRGHTPFGCSPVFAAHITSVEGTPGLRFWEFERARALPFQMDVWLSASSAWLYVRVAVFNPHPNPTPLYWWSNAAVPQTPDVRVIAPSRTALNFAYRDKLRCVTMPEYHGVDITYATRNTQAHDFFYRVASSHPKPWVAAVDGAGRGLIQVSSGKLRGRKFFVWGESTGGHQRQRFLTEGDRRYLEIQAGVAPTQYEAYPMAPQSRLDWVEAYGMADCEPGVVHGGDYDIAIAEVERGVECAFPGDRLEAILRVSKEIFDAPPTEMIQMGSGWGALENLRRERAGEMSLIPHHGISFPASSLGPDQVPWIALVESGVFPDSETANGFQGQGEWLEMLEASASDNWFIQMHRGVMRYQTGDLAGANEAWQTSLRHRETAMVWRNLAILQTRNGDAAQALSSSLRSYRLAPTSRAIVVECLLAQFGGGEFQTVLDIVSSLPQGLRSLGRVQLILAKAALALGQLETVEAVLNKHFVIPDMRENEITLSEIWFEWQAHRMAITRGEPLTPAIVAEAQQLPLPLHFDFRQAIA